MLQKDDIILIEGFPKSVGSEAWLAHFGIVRIVDNSMPQRSGTTADMLRAIAITVGLLVTLVLAATNRKNLGLNVLATLLLCFLFVIKATTPKEAYSTLNPSVLLSIVGALALGDAVESSGLANFLADVIVKAFAPFGKYAVLLGIYIAAASLGLVITNPAVVAILGEIGMACTKDPDSPGLRPAEVALVLVWASSFCAMSPYAYATNLMILPVGKYTWGDFITFGAPCQFIHMIVAVAITPFCASFAGY
jgi:di/tricarboxylate transporter